MVVIFNKKLYNTFIKIRSCKYEKVFNLILSILLIALCVAPAYAADGNPTEYSGAFNDTDWVYTNRLNADGGLVCGVGENGKLKTSDSSKFTVTSAGLGTVESRIAAVKDNLAPGKLYLFHDYTNNVNTIAAMEEILPWLANEGYALVTASELIRLYNYTMTLDNSLGTW